MQKFSMKTFLLSFVIAVSLVAYAKGAKSYEATVDRVVDGDTLVCMLDLGEDVFKKTYVRFHKASAPETSTEAGLLAKKNLSDLLPRGTPLRLEVRGKSHGRLVCVVWAGNVNINDQAIRLGICRVTSSKERF